MFSRISIAVKRASVPNRLSRFCSQGAPQEPKPSRAKIVASALVYGLSGIAIGLYIYDANDKKSDMVNAPSDYFHLAEPQGMITERVFMDLSIGGEEPERIVIGMYGRECPNTVKNFTTIAQGTTTSTVTGRPLSYEGSKFHRVIPSFMIQGGDFTNFDGTGGESIFGRPFKDESFQHKHTGLGVVSMANRGKDTNTSQFFICVNPTVWLDGKHVVFGQVLHGAATLRKIEALGGRTGAVSKEVKIVKCGVLPPLEQSAAANAPESEHLDETGRRRDRIMK
jgi:cyclophilin family peptidyl-prolyl cis-trans isomerase